MREKKVFESYELRFDKNMNEDVEDGKCLLFSDTRRRFSSSPFSSFITSAIKLMTDMKRERRVGGQLNWWPTFIFVTCSFLLFQLLLEFLTNTTIFDFLPHTKFRFSISSFSLFLRRSYSCSSLLLPHSVFFHEEWKKKEIKKRMKKGG